MLGNSVTGVYEEENDIITCYIQTWRSGNEFEYAFWSDSEATGEIKFKRFYNGNLELESFSEIRGKVIESDEEGNEIDNGFKNLEFKMPKDIILELK